MFWSIILHEAAINGGKHSPRFAYVPTHSNLLTNTCVSESGMSNELLETWKIGRVKYVSKSLEVINRGHKEDLVSVLMVHNLFLTGCNPNHTLHVSLEQN